MRTIILACLLLVAYSQNRLYAAGSDSDLACPPLKDEVDNMRQWYNSPDGLSQWYNFYIVRYGKPSSEQHYDDGSVVMTWYGKKIKRGGVVFQQKMDVSLKKNESGYVGSDCSGKF